MHDITHSVDLWTLGSCTQGQVLVCKWKWCVKCRRVEDSGLGTVVVRWTGKMRIRNFVRVFVWGDEAMVVGGGWWLEGGYVM